MRLPCLQDRRLIRGDFFDETLPGLNTETDAGRYDLVIGDPPRGKNSIRDISTSRPSAGLRTPGGRQAMAALALCSSQRAHSCSVRTAAFAPSAGADLTVGYF